MDNSRTIYLKSRKKWHDWLEQNYEKEKEVWLIYYRKYTNVSSISYEDSLEEALCFGWVDSIIKRIDESKFARKFTPRTDTRKWSDKNIRKIRKLIEEGRITAAGLSKIDRSILNGKASEAPKKKDFMVPTWVIQAIRDNEKAFTNFNKLAPSHKRNYIRWVMSAKKEETRTRRLEEVIEVLGQNKKLGMK
jgi:uncharacterized protein YdeI (YjbR/CyaY-like superfamily)